MLSWKTKKNNYVLAILDQYLCMLVKRGQPRRMTRIHSEILTFERKIPRKIYGPTKNTTTDDYEMRKNSDLKQLYSKLNIKNILYAKKL